ncbi:site-specific integrase [Xanthobacter autotrophicus]|uniref:site-specific integrase n=1 Tax=Xanthobacter autotrophicus TaxID=280 RepID=UPI00372A3B9D
MMKIALAGMRFDEIRGVLKQHFQEALQQEKDRIAEQGRLDQIEIAALSNGESFAREALAEGMGLHLDLPHMESDEELAATFAKRYGLKLDPNTKTHNVFIRELKMAYRDFCASVLAYDKSLDSYDLSESPALPLTQATQANAPACTLKDLVQKFTTEQGRAGLWRERSEQQKVQHLDLLQEILGESRDILSINRQDTQRVKDILLKYPKNRNKISSIKNLSIEQIVNLNSIETLSVRTINLYLQSYGSLFGWAKRNGYVTENIFDGITLRQNKQATDTQRDAFSPDQINLILRELLTNESGLIRKGYQKWGSLIGIYTGARLNEVCQIHLDDIKEIDGIWCFDMNDAGDGKRLKNAASRRMVPIHSRLLELGLLKHVATLKEAGETRLFPDFSFSPKEGYGRALGRWFNDRFLVQLGIKSTDLVFHSLRHTMVTRLMQAGVEENHVKALVGHTREGVTQQHYFKQGYTLAQLKGAIEKFQPSENGAGRR